MPADFTKDRDIAIKNEFLISTEREKTRLEELGTNNNGINTNAITSEKESFGFG